MASMRWMPGQVPVTHTRRAFQAQYPTMQPIPLQSRGAYQQRMPFTSSSSVASVPSIVSRASSPFGAAHEPLAYTGRGSVRSAASVDPREFMMMYPGSEEEAIASEQQQADLLRRDAFILEQRLNSLAETKKRDRTGYVRKEIKNIRNAIKQVHQEILQHQLRAMEIAGRGGAQQKEEDKETKAYKKDLTRMKQAERAGERKMKSRMRKMNKGAPKGYNPMFSPIMNQLPPGYGYSTAGTPGLYHGPQSRNYIQQTARFQGIQSPAFAPFMGQRYGAAAPTYTQRVMMPHQRGLFRR